MKENVWKIVLQFLAVLQVVNGQIQEIVLIENDQN